jgi:hydrogenase-4 component B
VLNTVISDILKIESSGILGNYNWLKLNWISGSGANSEITVSPVLILILLSMVIILTYVVVKKFGRGGKVRIDETWNCGEDLTPRMEYTATSFSKPIRIIFKFVLFPTRKVEREYELKPYFTRRISYKGDIKPVFEDMLYNPATDLFIKLSDKMRTLQSGSIHLYLGYILVTLVILLIITR